MTLFNIGMGLMAISGLCFILFAICSVGPRYPEEDRLDWRENQRK